MRGMPALSSATMVHKTTRTSFETIYAEPPSSNQERLLPPALGQSTPDVFRGAREKYVKKLNLRFNFKLLITSEFRFSWDGFAGKLLYHNELSRMT
jgi:hypothetical protein